VHLVGEAVPVGFQSGQMAPEVAGRRGRQCPATSGFEVRCLLSVRAVPHPPRLPGRGRLGSARPASARWTVRRCACRQFVLAGEM